MRILLFTLVLAFAFSAQAQTVRWNNSQPATTASADPSVDQRGYAVYYADYYEGNPTALGETFHQNLMTAAHQKLPLGTIVEVTRIDNNMTTTVRINDRGAYCDGCIIDLSKAAAREIDLLQAGRSQVQLRVIGFSNVNPPSRTSNYTATNNSSTYTSASTEPRFTNRGGAATPSTYSTSSSNNYEPAQQRRVPENYSYPPTESNLQTRGISTAATTTATNSSVTIMTTPISAYAVQLGSYGNFANAERHVLSMQTKGFDSLFVYQDQRPDGSLINRVMVAPFTSSADAQKYLQDLQTYHEMAGLVVRMR